MEKKFVFQIIGLIAIILLGTYYTRNPDILNFLTGTPPSQTELIKIDNTTIKVEIADTPTKRSKGLSGRERLASDSGMLFIFETLDTHRFWMKGMLIPLDIIWIKDNRVVDLVINASAPKVNISDQELTIYQPREPVNNVLEVNGGFVNQHKIAIGDTIILPR